MEQGIDFDDEENDFNAINSSVTKRKLRIESDSENEDVCDASSNIKSNKLIESDHSVKGVDVLEKEHVNILEHAMEGVEEDADVSEKEDEHVSTKTTLDLEDKGHVLSPVSDKKTSKNVSRRLAVVDSDSEDSESGRETTKKLATVHSDSEDEHTSSSSSTSEDERSSVKNGELITEDNPDVLATPTLQKPRWAALCNSESSDDESPVSHSEISIQDLPKSKQVSKSRKPKLPSKPKEKKMTTKEALQQRQEITSESQRMVRESRVSLPYHVPKARSIKEFLQNRPKFASPLLQNACRTPPSLAMKMSAQQLQDVAKKLEERNKEIEKFYESESESEEEAPIDEPAHDEENINKGVNNLNRVNDQNEENARESADDFDVTINLPTGVNNQSKENVSEINGDVNLMIESNEVTNKENVTDMEENGGEVTQEIVINQTEEMDTLVMPNSSYEADTSNPNGLETSTKIIEDIQNKTDLEFDSLQKSNDIIQNDSNPPVNTSIEILEDIQNKTDLEFDSLIKSNDIIQNDSNPPVNTSIEILENAEIIKNKFLEDSGNSIAYEFNLDDIEESEGMAQPQLQEKLQEPDIPAELQGPANLDDKVQEPDIPVEVPEQTVEEQHFQRMLRKYEGESSPIVEKRLSTLELLKQKLGDTVPCLKVAPGEEINLDDDAEDADGITQLKERFIKHVSRKLITKHKVHLSVVNLSQGEITKETVAMSVDADEQPAVVNETPGSKLRKLKNELEMQMAQRRSDLWQQRQSDFKKVEAEEKADYETEAILDDEEEAELTEGDSSDEEMENDEKLMDVEEESNDKCAFLDDQAEDEDDDEEENAELNKVDGEDELNDNEEGDNGDLDETEECDDIITRKPRRLIIGNSENSDSDEEIEPSFRKNVDASLSSTDTAEIDELPPNLPNLYMSEQTPSKSKSQFSFLSPVHQLTGLQSLNSGSKFLVERSPILHSTATVEPSPLKETSFSVEDSEDTANSQVNLEQPAVQETSPIENTAPTTQDFLNICSGSFSIDGETQNNEDLKSQTLENDAHISMKSIQPTQINLNVSKEVKNLYEDNLITQLLNEEELEQFKKKFNSPLVPNLIVNHTNTKSGRLIIDSSDEENEDKFEPRKKTKKKLDFSDDESDEESEEDKEEEIELHENISADELTDEESSNRVMEYDSEENEIEVEVEKKQKPSAGVKSREFFENEAELSESEWGSEDEDEKGLDILETEQGDADVFDEDQMKNDLEKIHMRRVLDQDNQEIKMLQELLLEDGELHGTGRQKQFRWRNIDDMDNEDARNDADVDVYMDEEESEEQWRKLRHEREMFLKNKSESSTSLQSDNLTESENDSQILKLGEEALRKGTSKVALEKSRVISNIVEKIKPFPVSNTRGSFLARSDQFLSKLAEINKVNTSVSTKNIKKIVFETRSTENEDIAGPSNGKKRKASEGTPYMIKKLRLSSNLSPSVNNVDRKKQLFN